MGDELMNAEFTMDGLEAMVQMLEVLVARIELLEKKLNEACSCQQWASYLRPGVVSQKQESDTSEIMPQG